MNTLSPFFDWLLIASARAAMLTLVVLMAQAVLRHRVPSRWLYAIWLPVLLVVLVPIFPESRWSVGSIIQSMPAPPPASSLIENIVPLPALSASLPTMDVPEPIN